MHCMKCGKKIKDSQVFCDECLAIMDTYPVKPGTPIQLPTIVANNFAAPKAKNNKRKQKTPEEIIVKLRRSNRWLSALLILFVLATIALLVIVMWLIRHPVVANTIDTITRLI